MRISISKMKERGISVHFDDDSVYFTVENRSAKLDRLVNTLAQEMHLNDMATDEFGSVVHRFSVLQAIKSAS